MGQRIRLFESHPGLAWLLLVLGVLCFIMLVMLLLSSLFYRPTSDPVVLKYFNSGFLAKAAQYNRLSMVISVSVKVITWLFMAAAVWVLWRCFPGTAHVRIYIAAGYIALFYIALNIILLPLAFYRGYTIEHQFGLSSQSAGMWFSDFAREKAIEMVISIAAFTGLYALMVYASRGWWLIAASAMAVFIVLGVYLFPVLIDPLFYDFRKLEDQTLRKDLLEVTDSAGVEVNDILVADASKRTVKANAYFTGFGNTRRIVLYDNLVNDFTREEVINVVAHEAAHWRYSHIVKSILLGISAGFLGLYLLSLILKRAGLVGDLRSIFIIILLVSFITFLSAPLQNALSRHFERQADQLATDITGESETQVRLLQGLAASNLSNVDPHPLIRIILYSHPPILERIRAAGSVDQ